jgi:hypothetical protein
LQLTTVTHTKRLDDYARTQLVNDALKIILTACVTLAGGTILFCGTTLLQRLVFEPLLAFRKTLGEVSYCLQYHAWVFHTTHPTVQPERLERVFEELRSQTARLRADANAIIGYDFFARMGFIPPYSDLLEAAGRLIRVSNRLGQAQSDQMDDLMTVQNLLKIDIGRPKYQRQA